MDNTEKRKLPLGKFWTRFPAMVASTLLLTLILATFDLGQVIAPPWQIQGEAAKFAFDSLTLRVDTARSIQVSGNRILLPLVISPVDNLFRLKRSMEGATFASRSKSGNRTTEGAAQILPDYRGFANLDEMAKEVHADLSLPLTADPTGHYEVVRSSVPASSAPLVFEVGLKPGVMAQMIAKAPSWFWPISHRVLQVFVLLSLISNLVMLSRIERASCFLPAAGKPSLSPYLLGLALAFLGFLVLQTKPMSTGALPAVLGFAAGALSIGWVIGWALGRVGPQEIFTRWVGIYLRYKNWLAWICVTALIIVFSRYLMHSATFKWSIFEERDFLRASEVARLESFPVLGPQLLAGGQTPGGILYLWLAPFLKLSPTPETLAWMTKATFLASAILVAGILRFWVGMVGAICGLLFFCASHTVLSIAYWPLHPNLSILIYYLFLEACLSFSLRRQGLTAILAAVALAVLMQLHITYCLLLIPFGLMLTQSGAVKRWRLVVACALSIAVFYVPYLIQEISTQFDNLRQIFAAPRYQPSYVPQVALVTNHIVTLLNDWLRGGVVDSRGFFSTLWLWIASALLCSGTIYMAFFSSAPVHCEPGETAEKNEKKIVFSRCLLLVFGLPFTLIDLAGAGYSYRHLISCAPGLFLILGFGAQQIWSCGKTYGKVCVALVVGLLSFSYLKSMSDPGFTRELTVGGGEWAVDYAERREVAQHLIRDLHVDLEQYSQNVYWWWFGWSMAPELYQAEIAALGLPSGESRLRKDQSLFLLNDKPSALFESRYELQKISQIKSISVYTASPKAGSLVASNARNVARLSPLEAAIEQYRLPEDVDAVEIQPSSSIELSPPADGSHRTFIFGFHRGRIKLHLVLKRVSPGEIEWALHSPSLSGYYQEIKTLWRPQLILVDRAAPSGRAEELEVPVGPEVLGDLLVKTPRSGRISWTGELHNIDVKLGVAGWFDQSDMKEPELKSLRLGLRD